MRDVCIVKVSVVFALLAIVYAADNVTAVQWTRVRVAGRLRIWQLDEPSGNATTDAVANTAALPSGQAHRWSIAGGDLQQCLIAYPAGSLLLEFWEAVRGNASLITGKGEHVVAVLTPQPLDPSRGDPASAPPTQADSLAAEGQLSYQRVWGPALKSVPAASPWVVTVVNTRQTDLRSYSLRLTCAATPPCPAPLLGRGPCSGDGACVVPMPTAKASPAARPPRCKCDPGWGDFGCSARAPLLARKAAQAAILLPASYAPATGSFQRQLFRLEIPPGTQAVLLQLSTPASSASPGKPQLCLLPASQASSPLAPLPPAAFNCTPPPTSGFLPRLQYLYLATSCPAASLAHTCLPLLESSYLVAAQNLDGSEAASANVEADWQLDGSPVCPLSCSTRGPCSQSNSGAFQCDCRQGYTGDYCESELRRVQVLKGLVQAAVLAPISLVAGEASYVVVHWPAGHEASGSSSSSSQPFWLQAHHAAAPRSEQTQVSFVVRLLWAVGQPASADVPALFAAEDAGSTTNRIATFTNSLFNETLFTAQLTAAIRMQQLPGAAADGTSLVLMISNDDSPAVTLQLSLGPAQPPPPYPPAARTPSRAPRNESAFLGLNYTYAALVLGGGACLLMVAGMCIVYLKSTALYRRLYPPRQGPAAAPDTPKGIPAAVIATFPTFTYSPPAAAPAPLEVTVGAAATADASVGAPQPPPGRWGARGLFKGARQQSLDARADAPGPVCAVCLAQYEEGEVLRRLPCAHEFHRDCIDGWLPNHTSCPICRCDLHGGPSPEPADVEAGTGGSGTGTGGRDTDPVVDAGSSR